MTLADVEFEHDDRLVVMGLDTSLTSTGCARVVCGPLAGDPWFFRVRSTRKGYPRMQSMVTRIGQAIERCAPDLIVVEGPALYAKGAYFHENAGLWWMVTYRIWALGIPMAIVPPSVLKKYATGNGGSNKTAMCVAAVRRFDLPMIGEDEADALWLAAAGAQHLGQPVVQMPAAQVTALEAVKKGRPVVPWPPGEIGKFAAARS